MKWIKAAASSGNGECVEVAFEGRDVLVRHSRFPAGHVHRFTWAEWRAFLAGAKNGEFDLPEVTG